MILSIVVTFLNVSVPGSVPDAQFIADRKAACARYEQASNDIKKSAVFTEFFKGLKGKSYELKDVSGTVKEIETTHGGGTVTFTVETAYGTFSNNDALQDGFFPTSAREIKTGSKLYKAIGELDVGAPVRVTVSKIAPEKNPFSEQESVCGENWIVKYVAVTAAK
jgi:hypothetical protein